MRKRLVLGLIFATLLFIFVFITKNDTEESATVPLREEPISDLKIKKTNIKTKESATVPLREEPISDLKIKKTNNKTKESATVPLREETSNDLKIKKTNNEITTVASVLKDANDISCYIEPSTRNGIQNFYSNDSKKQADMPIPGRSIFFHETSCFGEDGIVITAREACAVESAALMNPQMKVYLLILSPAKLSDVSKPIVNQLMSYKNVRIRRIFMDDYVKNTPLQDWYASGVLKKSRWPRSHMSDILRYLTLWKFGGIYLDLDVVVITSLDGLTNFSGAQDSEIVAAGVMGFDVSSLGREFANACIHELKTNFWGDAWGHNGPGVITRTLQKICATTYPRNMTESRCHGFKVFPPSVFYPITYMQWRLYFNLDTSNVAMNMLDKARAIHVWNKLSKEEKIKVGSQAPYAIVASKYCPKVYNNCGTIF